MRKTEALMLAIAAAVMLTGCASIVRQEATRIAAQVTTGPRVPPRSLAATAACNVVHGDFARDDNWDGPRPAFRLYECDNVPYLGSDGSIYQVNLRYSARLSLIAPRGVIGNGTRRQCDQARYPMADVNPCPGRWNAALRICMPTGHQLATMAG